MFTQFYGGSFSTKEFISVKIALNWRCFQYYPTFVNFDWGTFIKFTQWSTEVRRAIEIECLPGSW